MKKKILSLILGTMMMVQLITPVMAETGNGIEIDIFSDTSQDKEDISTAAEEDSFVRSGIYTNEISTPLPSNSSATVMVGTTVGIKKLSEDTILLKVVHCARTKIAATDVCETKVIGNEATFNWEDIGFASSGTGKIIFNENNISLTLDTIVGGTYTYSTDNEILEPNNEATLAESINKELEEAGPNSQ